MFTEGLLGAMVGAGKGLKEGADREIEQMMKDAELERQKNLARFRGEEERKTVDYQDTKSRERDEINYGRDVKRDDTRYERDKELKGLELDAYGQPTEVIEGDDVQYIMSNKRGQTKPIAKTSLSQRNMAKGKGSASSKDATFDDITKRIDELTMKETELQMEGEVDLGTGERKGGATPEILAGIKQQKEQLKNQLRATWPEKWRAYSGESPGAGLLTNGGTSGAPTRTQTPQPGQIYATPNAIEIRRKIRSGEISREQGIELLKKEQIVEK